MIADTAEDLTFDAITADYRIWQRKRGHRYSLDDLVTAWQATRARPEARTVIDIGCGIGSVLLMVAWKLPRARLWGVEAQELSATLAARSVEDNGLTDRVVLANADLREWSVQGECPPAELVTGTPPYLPVGTAVASPDPQRAAARLELRGGIEDYLLAASRLLVEDGAFVVCADGRRPDRVLNGAKEAGLAPLLRTDVWARADAKDPLFSVWTLERRYSTDASIQHHHLSIRDEHGQRTPASNELRLHFGLAVPRDAGPETTV